MTISALPADINRSPAPDIALANAFEKRTFLIGCMLATALPIVFFAGYYAFQPAQKMQSLNQLLSFLLVLSTMHVALTVYFYLDREYREFMMQDKRYYVYFPLAVVAACGLFTLSFGKTGVLYLTVFYHAWLLYHYGRQNFGLMSFVCASERGKPLKSIERFAFGVAPVGAILGAHNIAFKDAFGAAAQPSFMLGLALYAIAVAAALYAALVVRRDEPFAVRAYLLVLILFWAPTFLFTNYSQAIMGYATGHALQYFLFMYFSAAGAERGARQGVILLGIGAVVGWAIIATAREHEIWGPALQVMLGVELGIVMWHFIVDAGLWKMRYKWQREQVHRRFGFMFPR